MALSDESGGDSAAAPPRHRLLDFTLLTFPEYHPNWHHAAVCRQLDQMIHGNLKRLMLFMPPRSGKSELVSRRLPALVLGLDPNAKIITCSHTASLSSAMNRDVQRVIDSDQYQKLFSDSHLRGYKTGSRCLRNNHIFETVDSKGYYRSAGVGGGITGMGFDFGIIDDPVKDAHQAYSERIRDNIWEWFTTTFYTRRQPNARILITLTRWHPDDLAGRLLRLQEDSPGADKDKWKVISFPAICEGSSNGDDPRREGEPLWRGNTTFERPALDSLKATIGSVAFQSLYQQNPLLEGGNHFKENWFMPRWTWADNRNGYRLLRADGSIGHYPNERCSCFAIADPAASERESADFTAIGIFAKTPENDLLVLHMHRERLSIEKIVPTLLAVCNEWKPTWVGFEAVGFQAALSLNAQRTPGMPSVRPVAPRGQSKFERALPAMAKADCGQIFLPKSADWTEAFIEECVKFRGKGDVYDDQVDVLAYAVIGMGTGEVPTMIVK